MMIWMRLWCLLCLFGLCTGAHSETTPIHVLASHKIPVLNTWCATPANTTLDRLQQQPCTAIGTPIMPNQNPGFDERAFWLQLNLHNPSDRTLTRWLAIGHPRLEQVRLYSPQANQSGWQIHDVGIATPMAERGDTERRYQVLPIELAANSQVGVWVRVASRTSVDLSATLWHPNTYQDFYQQHQTSLLLALGGLLAGMLSAGIAFLYAKEKIYLFFTLAMVGEFFIEGFRTGWLQQSIWPSAWGMPVEVAAVASLVATGSFFAFFVAFLPIQPIYRWMHFGFHLFFWITTAFQLISIFIAYQWGVHVWTVSVNFLIIMGVLMCFISWYHGTQAAGMLFLAFVWVGILELLRLTSALGWLPFSWQEILIGPWALVLTTPIILLGVFQRSQELNIKLQQAESEKAAKTLFLAQMSHELRTPLDTILSNVQLLMKKYADSQWLHDNLQHIQHSARHLLGMIDDILEYVRSESGTLRLEPEMVLWSAFLHEIHHNASLLAARQHNTLTLEYSGEVPPMVELDAARLRQILDNLVNNAARHTRQGHIRIACHVKPIDESNVCTQWSVSDTGEGIASEDLLHIFQPFKRGRNTQRERKGLGMGLAIAQQWVHAMGGDITVSSTPQQGSTFTFSIHLCVLNTPPPHEQPTTVVTQQAKHPALNTHNMNCFDLERRPPAAQLAQLRQWTEDGELSSIMEWAQTLSAEQPHLSHYAQWVYEAAQDLDFPTLHKLSMPAATTDTASH